MTTFKPAIVPASFFGIVLGLAGLGNAWRTAHQVYGAPALVGGALMAITASVWALVLILFVLKWVFAREQATDEVLHPVQCCFIGLAGVSTVLIGTAANPYSRPAAEILKRLGVDMLQSTVRRCAVALALACASANNFAEEVSPNQGVTGDWGGLRTRLYKDGVDFQLGFVTEAAWQTDSQTAGSQSAAVDRDPAWTR